MKTTIWNFLAPADRETFISGVLAWLMDCNGNHDLKSEFLEGMFQKVQLKINNSSNIKIATEDSLDNDKRFDISVKINNNLFAIFEVKCKTKGTKKQLERYSKKANSVFRIGFDEWNFTDIDDNDRKKYPLIKYSEIADILKNCMSYQKSQYFNFLQDFSNQFINESEYFISLKKYFIDEIQNEIPQIPHFHRYSQRFYNMLFWDWFIQKIKNDVRFKNLNLLTKSERSGVWFILSPGIVDSHATKKFNHLNLQLQGKFDYWVHIELVNKTGIIAEKGEKVGYIQLRISHEDDRDNIYNLISSPNNAIQKNKFIVSKRPSKNYSYYSVLKRELTIDEFRYSKLTEIISLLL